MAQSKDWYPQEEAKLQIFAENYADEIDNATILSGQPVGTFSVSKTSVETYLTTRADLKAALNEVVRLRAQQVEQAATMEADVRAVAKQLKGTIGMPPQVITMLELNGTPNDPLARVGAQAPELKMSVELGIVKGRYTKNGHQGVDVYSCRTGETEFILLGRFNMNKFTDERPNRVAGQPEQRDYYAVYVDKDKQVGGQSTTASVVVGSRPG